MLERIFHLQENQTTVRRELFAGLTRFKAMAHVVLVNPQNSSLFDAAFAEFRRAMQFKNVPPDEVSDEAA